MDNKEEVKKLVESDPEFIFSKKYKYKLSQYKKAHPDKTPDRQIAYMLACTEAEIQGIYEGIIKKARQILKINIS
jgi:hypothetical protein